MASRMSRPGLSAAGRQLIVQAELFVTQGTTLGAAAAGGLVWRLASGGIEGLDPADGHLVAEASVDDPVAVAGSRESLVVLTQHGDLLEVDPGTGDVLTRTEVGPDCRLIGGQETAWLYQPTDGAARRIDRGGILRHSVPVDGATHLATSGDDLWWVTEYDTARCSDGRFVDLDEPLPVSGAVACAGSLWLGAMGHLVHVSLWRGDLGPSLRTNIGTPTVLACSGGRVVGADSTTAFVLDPAVDADVVPVGQPLSGPPVVAVGFRNTGWILSDTDALVIHF